jgi:protein-tyrosine-phosphatase
MAAGIFNKLAADGGLGTVAASCGTHASSTYRVPPIVLQLMSERQVDLSRHRSTQITKQLVDDADLILAMDEQHINYIQSNFPQAAGRTFLLREYVKDRKGHEIFDPIGQSEEVYRDTAEVIERCIEKLLKLLEKAK